MRLVGALFPAAPTILFGLAPGTDVRVRSESELLVKSPPACRARWTSR
ncbi:MAG: hypothetical protein HC813_00995 [Planctomycetes bacterium]|nr:hypothetical protein [Planctomycetota bacterium]